LPLALAIAIPSTYRSLILTRSKSAISTNIGVSHVPQEVLQGFTITAAASALSISKYFVAVLYLI